jgi:hypothetical protein
MFGIDMLVRDGGEIKQTKQIPAKINMKSNTKMGITQSSIVTKTESVDDAMKYIKSIRPLKPAKNRTAPILILLLDGSSVLILNHVNTKIIPNVINVNR